MLVWGFILAICVGLVWGLMQLERRWRVRLVPDDRALRPAQPRRRDWQLWLEDARRAAAAGLWREAIHFVYWASISRLESRRSWPADRARTPREYLALVAADDPRKPGLATLTGSFERIWYGGRPAGEADYRRAERSLPLSSRQATLAGSGALTRRNEVPLLPRCQRSPPAALVPRHRLSLSPSLIGFLLPNGNNNNNPLPSSYLAGQHGARAAYETLLRSGYPIERWERPLSDLAATAGPDTVVIFAQPFTREPATSKPCARSSNAAAACSQPASGAAFILPGEASDTPDEFTFAACKLEPEGLDPLAGSGEVWMVPEATWRVGNPAHPRGLQLRRPARGCRIRLGQRPRRVVGQLHAARKRISRPRQESRPAAQLARPARWPPLLLG